MSFHVGDKVRIEFDATIIDGPNSAVGRLYTYTVTQKAGASSGATHYVYLTEDNARVTKPAEPESWPPQAGDIWNAGGIEYFVYSGILGLNAFPFDGASSGRESYSESPMGNSLSDFKALSPVLVRRRSNADWANAAADYINRYHFR